MNTEVELDILDGVHVPPSTTTSTTLNSSSPNQNHLQQPPINNNNSAGSSPSNLQQQQQQPFVIGSLASSSTASPTTSGGRLSQSLSTNQFATTALQDPLKAEVQKLVDKNKDHQLFGLQPLKGITTTTTPGNALSTQNLENESSVKERILSCCFSLRVSTLATLIVLFTVMILAFVIIIGTILPVNFGELEKNDSSNASKRSMKALYDDLRTNLGNLLPFSAWTEPYNHINNVLSGTPNAYTNFDDYMSSNFPRAIMASSKVNWVIYYFKNGTRIISRSYSFDTDTVTSSSDNIPDILKQLSLSNPLMYNMDKSYTRNGGFVNYKSQLIMLSAAPITISDWNNNSDTNGVLVFGRIMSSTFINSIANSAQLCLSMHLLDDTSDKVVEKFSKRVTSLNGTFVLQTSFDWPNLAVFAFDPLETTMTLSKRQCYRTDGSTLSEQRFASYVLLNDIYGQPLMIVRTDIARDVYFLGIQSILLAIGLLLLVCLLASVVVILFVEKRVLSRILHLTSRIQEITASNDTKQRIAVRDGQTDELGKVSKNINYMLNSLDMLVEQQLQEQELLKKLLERISEAEERTSSIMNSIKDIVLTVTAEGVVTHANTAFYDRFGYSAVDVEGSGKITLDKLFPQLKDVAKTGDSLGQVISSYDDQMTHPFTGLTKKRKNIDFDAYVTKAKQGNSTNGQHMFVFVGRVSSQLLGTIPKSGSLLGMEGEFDRLLLNPEEKEKFKLFCRNEKSEENMLFMDAVLEYKSLKHTHERMIKQEAIIRTFLKGEESPLAVNVSGAVVKKELTLIEKGVGQLDLFDKLYQTVKNNLASDTYSRYKMLTSVGGSLMANSK
ncbi:hypothetical protein C9374_006285 [Naegleria lovaniensis]|uniref:PAS domain-containing protein n=1 Tax=Naegleria lovaniensis TaxID=51637 RepID=A0AA88GLH0_NAELO|nr:uncharacterized protein C9374_006285 [Naegleria lovaniensis]KAG2381296.1 hypothetical protein C9374_006285 [Naegleria lovaniensis]